ncbi:MAG: FecR domain-containing protein [Sediminibacterium sp.]
MQEKDFDRLVKRYLDNSATPLEKELVEAHILLMEEMSDQELSAQELAQYKAEVWRRLQEPPQRSILRIMKPLKWVAAAVVLFAIATTVFLLTKNPTVQPVVTANADVKAPASNRAMITLGNGQRVYLDSAANGQLASQSGVDLVKLEDGKIVYSGKTNELQFNTLTNPKGSRTINMILPDGSQVWLNAGSSVRFPIAFVAKERRITMDGEMYLEVAHDPQKPFIVQKGDMIVQVYGTHFNVKAYDNDPDLKVTLLEGSVSVSQKNTRQLLKPGQQAVIKTEKITLVEDADTEEAIAWKNGKTSFHSADLLTVLREIERWYDINISIEGSVPEKSFYADVNRGAPLSDVLKVLDDNKVKYLFDEKTKRLTIIQ